MVINTGCRTDIPAYYSEWFYNRIREGYVPVRNPYYPQQVTRYLLTPEVMDLLCFCTKNPEPMLSRLDELQAFSQFWFVTITPYGKDVEPHVPDADRVMEAFRRLSERVGKHAMSWRYDPGFLDEKYTLDFHMEHFEHMAQILAGSTEQCVVSFIDLYAKTKRNFPGVREVTAQEHALGCSMNIPKSNAAMANRAAESLRGVSFRLKCFVDQICFSQNRTALQTSYPVRCTESAQVLRWERTVLSQWS